MTIARGVAVARMYFVIQAVCAGSSARLGEMILTHSGVPQSCSWASAARSMSSSGNGSSSPLGEPDSPWKSTSALTRSGCIAAKVMAIWPPSATAIGTAVSESTASKTTRRSSAHSSHVGTTSVGSRSDAPRPRLSKIIRRPNDAKRLRKRAARRVFPTHVDVAQVPCEVHEIKGPITDDLVGDLASILSLCVPALWARKAPTKSDTPGGLGHSVSVR